MDAKKFLWAGGIEDTFIVDPHRETGKTLEEYELIGHYDRWKEDLERAAGLGIGALRWGIPWHRVSPERGIWDWNWVDEVIAFMTGSLGLEPIADLLHYGTPQWLPDGIGDQGFEAAFLEYAARFAERYRGRIRRVTPINEPFTGAEFCGRRGDWPPYRKSDAAFFRLMATQAHTAVLASRLLKTAGFTNVHVEVAGFVRAAEPDLAGAAEEYTLQNFLYWDLILGKVDGKHGLLPALGRAGIGDGELSWFESNHADIDILGVNYYPQWSCQLLYRDGAGGVLRRPFNAGPEGLRLLLETLWSKYGLPLMVTETSHRGADWEKAEWLRAATAVAEEAVSRGIPVEGFTWFPLIDMIDWEYRNRKGDADAFLMDLGLIDLDRNEKGAADTYRTIIREHRNAHAL